MTMSNSHPRNSNRSRRFSGAPNKRPSLVEHYPPSSAGVELSSDTDWSLSCRGGDRTQECMTSLQQPDTGTNVSVVPTSSDRTIFTFPTAAPKTIPAEAVPRIPQVQPTRRRIHHLHNTAATASATQDEDSDDHDEPEHAAATLLAASSSPSQCCWWSVASESKRRKSLVQHSHEHLSARIPMVTDSNENTPTAWIPPTEVVMVVPVGNDDAAGRTTESALLQQPLSDTTAPSVSTTTSHPDPASSAAVAANEASSLSPEASVAALAQLARQLEYYFSDRNLSKDTYLQTLRTLNDGCVPATILADFAKVRTILGVFGVGVDNDDGGHDSRLHAVLQAVSEHTELLQIRSIETSTGKIVTDDTPSSAPTILAVGTLDHQPLTLLPVDAASVTTSPMSSTSTFCSSSATPSSNTTTTIILRDVPPDTTEDEVRELFQFDECPAIESLRPDVAHCWFVSLHTDSREVALRAVLHLRTATLRGEYVQARLRAAAAPPTDALPPPNALPSSSGFWGGMTPSFPGEWNGWLSPDLLMSGAAAPSHKKRNKNKKKNKKYKKRGPATPSDPTQEATVPPSLPSTANAANTTITTKATQKIPVDSPPPSLGEDHFPTLQLKKVEFDTAAMPRDTDDLDLDGEEGEEEPLRRCSSVKSISDAASTATTNSSSLDLSCAAATTTATPSSVAKAVKPVLGGYAAALLKAASIPGTTTTTSSPAGGVVRTPAIKRLSSSSSIAATSSSLSSTGSSSDTGSGVGGATVWERAVPSTAAKPPSAAAAAPTWGRGRSFADMVRRAAEPTVAVAAAVPSPSRQ